MTTLQVWRAYLTWQMLRILMLGFASGLILPLTMSTLSAYLWDHHIDIKTIGLFTAVALPYSWKFLWAPLIDNLKMPFLGRLMGKRRGWLIVVQLGLIMTIAACGRVNPVENAKLFAMLMLLIGFLSATQDIIVDALRIEIVSDRDQAMGATIEILGYRIGMLASSAGALYMAARFSWEVAFTFVAMLMFVGVIATLLQHEKSYSKTSPKQLESIAMWFKHAFWEPFHDFFKRTHALLILLMVVSYKLGDAYLGVMTTPFLLEMEFTKIELATYVKSYGFIASMIGTLWGGYVVKRRGYAKALIWGLYIQMFSNLIFILQYYQGHSIPTLILTITIENVTGGIGTAALVGYVSHLCSKEFTATQYALLSSIDSIARVTLPITSGYVVENIGWIDFFIFSAILNLPALCLAYFIFKHQMTVEKKHENYFQQRNDT